MQCIRIEGRDLCAREGSSLAAGKVCGLCCGEDGDLRRTQRGECGGSDCKNLGRTEQAEVCRPQCIELEGGKGREGFDGNSADLARGEGCNLNGAKCPSLCAGE